MTMLECAEFLKTRDRFLILTHLRPDGDTLGSASALCSALRRAGKTAYLFPNEEVTDNYAEYVKPFFAPSGFEPEFVLSADVADEELFPHGFMSKVDLCIDHHPSNTGFAPRTLLMPDKASCGEIVLELIRLLCGDVKKNEADLLYIALSTDTGCFCYANTNADTLRAAAELLELGADNKKINKEIFRTHSYERIKLEGLIYSGLHRYEDGTITIAAVTPEILADSKVTENDCEDLAGLPGRVKGTKIGITIRETKPGSCKVSVRTGKEYDASEICAEFAGGGHAMAAGCMIDGNCAEAERLIVEAISKLKK